MNVKQSFRSIYPPYNLVPTNIYKIYLYNEKKLITVCSDHKFASHRILVDANGNLYTVDEYGFLTELVEINGYMKIKKLNYCVKKVATLDINL